MSGISDDAPFARPRRSSDEDRRRLGGRRKADELPRTTITKKVVAVIVFLVNLGYLVVDQLFDQCGWFS